jgi:hypothetical protein
MTHFEIAALVALGVLAWAGLVILTLALFGLNGRHDEDNP